MERAFATVCKLQQIEIALQGALSLADDIGEDILGIVIAQALDRARQTTREFLPSSVAN